MRINTLSIVVAVLTLLVCIKSFLNTFPSDELAKTNSRESQEDIQLLLPRLDDSTVEHASSLLQNSEGNAQNTAEGAEQETNSDKKVQVRPDEVEVDGMLIRLVGVFNTNDNVFAVVERRDESNGQIVDKKTLVPDTKLGTFLVDSVSMNNVTLKRGDTKIVFEIYKKPKLVKG